MARLTGSKLTEFKLYAPQAKKVSLAGTFNKWDIKKLPAKNDSKGNWMVKVNLKPGRYEYKFVVDGAWMNDPRCTSCVANSFGSHNCVVEVK
ncbi:MAG: isoamylase early set domain-containing protein [Candidatus Omnitrophica bacterium]|nr:isoamylase early set domain-containing protein [Candidatus Omnitrophota bacterium]MDD5027504.1 isoamylase early set domain-containing protein [Candidatus Omnitrophota bacterium]MDD5662301.1 isoamylase early set domain-containing protein [Candidatus Omnitrophota bacterium]